ncbi:hypothetical protein Tco_0667305 [Tanacetum coccineum]
MAEYSQKWHNGTSRSRSTKTSEGLVAIQAQLNNLGREIKKVNEKVYAAQVGCEQCKGPPDSYPIRRIGSSQYDVSTGHNRTLMYKTRQTTIPFPSRLNGYYCDEKKGSYRPHFSEAYSEAPHIDNSIPRKEKDPERSSVSVMPFSTYLCSGTGELKGGRPMQRASVCLVDQFSSLSVSLLSLTELKHVVVTSRSVYKAGKRLLYVKRNKAKSPGKVCFSVGIEVNSFLKGLYLVL